MRSQKTRRALWIFNLCAKVCKYASCAFPYNLCTGTNFMLCVISQCLSVSLFYIYTCSCISWQHQSNSNSEMREKKIYNITWFSKANRSKWPPSHPCASSICVSVCATHRAAVSSLCSPITYLLQKNIHSHFERDLYSEYVHWQPTCGSQDRKRNVQRTLALVKVPLDFIGTAYRMVE